MKKFVNARAESLKPSGIRKFFDIVSEMKDAISLGEGEPDFVTPWNIRNAAVKSIQRGYTQYTGNRGLPQLREYIARYMKERFGAEYPPEHILVTVGASEGIDLVMRAVCEAGDEVLVPDPGYVSYFPCVQLAGGTPVAVPCSQENGFILTPEALEKAITPKTKAIVMPYPNNPTGGIMTKEQLEAIAPVIQKHDLLVISDEIYAELTYGGRHVSVASLPGMKERTVVIGGFSKSFAMTGWRLGFICSPPEIDAAVLKIHQYTLLRRRDARRVRQAQAVHGRLFQWGGHALFRAARRLLRFPFHRKTRHNGGCVRKRAFARGKGRGGAGRRFRRGGHKPCALFVCHEHGKPRQGDGAHRKVHRGKFPKLAAYRHLYFTRA